MTLFSKLIGDSKAIRDGLREQERIWPPPVSFTSKSKKTKKSTKSKDNDNDSDAYRTFNIDLDPNDDDSDSYKMKVVVFEDGNAEEFILWCMDVEDLFAKMTATQNATK